MTPAADPSRRARELYDGLVGRRTGIIRQIALVDPFDGDARLFHAGAQIANTHARFHESHLGLGVGGAGFDKEAAIVSALCEGVERYAASCYRPAQLQLATFRELGARALDPRRFVPFSATQRAEPAFPLAPLDSDTTLRWVSGTHLSTRAPVLVPAFAVYMPYVHAEPEPLLGVGLSTGLACADTRERAEEKALCEVVERDALALTWLLGATPPRIATDSIDPRLLPPRDRVDAFDLTTDLGVPVFLVRCVGRGPRGELISIGAACHADPRQALDKAALEASQDRVYVRMLIDRDPDWAPRPDFTNVTDFGLHARLYSGRPALARRGLAFLDDAPLGARAHAPVDALAQLTQRGLDAVSIDLTPPWAANLGLHVARVVVPDLVPLHGNHTMRTLGHARLSAAALPHATLRHELPLWPFPHAMP